MWCHAPLLAHNPKRSDTKPYLSRDEHLQKIMDAHGNILFISGHTHISMESPVNCVEHDEARNNIYINDGSVRPTTLLTEDGRPEEKAAERKTTEHKAGGKRKMTNEEKLDILVSTMLEYLEKQVKSLPEQGTFERHSVSMTYPGTTCDGFLIYEYDLTDSSQRGRRLRASMCRQGSDRMVSHYLFKGSKTECLAWLGEPGNQGFLKKDYAALLFSVEQADE